MTRRIAPRLLGAALVAVELLAIYEILMMPSSWTKLLVVAATLLVGVGILLLVARVPRRRRRPR